jgi:hypothetical protein
VAKIDSVYDFTDKALVELKSWLEPWFKTREGCECVPSAPSGDTIDAVLGGLTPAGIWKLNESSGHVAHDSSGNGVDMSTSSPELDPLWGAPAGPPGTQAADFQNGTSGIGATASRESRTWAALSGDFTAGIFINRNSTLTTQVMGQGNPGRAGGTGWMLAVYSGSTGGADTNRPYVQAAGLGYASANNPLTASTWAMIAVSKSGTAWTLNVNGLSQTATLSGSYTSSSSVLWIGHDGGLGGNTISTPAQFVGSYAFLIPSALTGAQLLEIYNSAALPAGANIGKALIATGLGGTYWDFASSGSGTTANRPTLTANGGALFVGTGYFDTTLGKPIWWNGTVWKDATGTTV